MKEQYSKRDEEVDTEAGCLIFYVELYISQSLSDQTNEPNIHSNYWRIVVSVPTAMPCVL